MAASQPEGVASTNVDQAVRLLKIRSTGSIPTPNPFEVFRISEAELLEILQRLEQLGVDPHHDDNLRCDYDTYYSELVIYMAPSGLHEHMLWMVSFAFMRWQDKLSAGHGKKAEFASKLGFSGKCAVKIKKFDNDTLSYKSPDSQVKHCHARYPGVIIEVAHVGREKYATRKAKDFVDATNNNVRAVLVIFTNPDPSTKEATFSIWRPKVVGDTLKAFQAVAEQPFRDADGNVVPNGQVRLNLSDFAFPDLVDKVLGDEDEMFIIPAEELCEILGKAEEPGRKRSQEKILRVVRSVSPEDKDGSVKNGSSP